MSVLTHKGAGTRQRLLDAATEELIASGGAFELAAVARRAGVSAGLPYRYFASKSALCVALVDDFFDAWEAWAYRPSFEACSDDWWVREQLRIEKSVSFFYAHPLGALLFTQLAGDAQVVRAVRQRLDAQVLGAAKNVARGKRLGRVPAHIDATLCGAMLMGGVYQTLSSALSRPTPLRRSRVVRELQGFMARVLCIEGGPDES